MLLQARNSITLLPNTFIAVQGTQSLTAEISDPVDCSNSGDYNYLRQNLNDNIRSDNVSGLVYSDSHYLFPELSVTGEKEFAALNKELKLYPNPATNNICISIANENLKECTLNVINVFGVKQKISLSKNINESALNIRSLIPGIYFVQVISKNAREFWQEKFVKEQVSY